MSTIKNALLTAWILSALLGSAGLQADQVWTYTYNTLGLVETADGPRTDVNDLTTYTYDPAGNRSSATNALNHLVQWLDYNGRGQPGRIIDANGVETVLTYHVRGWLLSSTVKDPGGDPARDALTQYTYDATGQLTRITLPDGSFLHYAYDAARRLTAIENALGERLEYTLDAAGNRTAEVIKNGSGMLRYTLTRTFDELSRVMDIVGAAGQTTHIDYDVNDNPTQVLDPKTQPTGQAYDALNRLLTVTEPTTATVSYAYDDQDRLIKVTDQRGLSTHYVYDAFDNLIEQRSPDTGTTTYSHDTAGNRRTRTDANQFVTEYQYDALNRLLRESYPADPSLNKTYTYDDTANGNYGIGRLTRIADKQGQIDFVYDHRGNLISKVYTIELNSYRIDYGYDLANNLSQITYPSGREVFYQRDGSGRVTAITTRAHSGAAIEPVISAIHYQPFGPLAGLTYGNGIVRTVTHDLDYRITDIEDLGQGTVLDLHYRYDLNSNIDRLADQQAAQHQLFGYDAVDRLTSADGTYGAITYSYDAAGNRLQRQQTIDLQTRTDTYTYALDSHRLDRVDRDSDGTLSQRTFSYDAAGNTTADNRPGQALSFTYSAENRLSLLSDNSVPSSEYGYNALGQRVAKFVHSGQAGSAHYHYDEAGQLLAVSHPESGRIEREYLYLDNRRLGLFVSSAFQGTWVVQTDPVIATLTAGQYQQAYSADGSGATLYVDQSSGVDHKLTVQRFDTDRRYQPPVTLASSVGPIDDYRLYRNDNGTMAVIWAAGNQTYFSYYDPAQAQWLTPADDLTAIRFFTATLTAAGKLLLVYSEYQNGYVHYSREYTPAAGWSTPQPFAAAWVPAAIKTDSAGNALAVVFDDSQEVSNLYALTVHRYQEGSGWQLNPIYQIQRNVHALSFAADDFAVDSNGDALIAWSETLGSANAYGQFYQAATEQWTAVAALDTLAGDTHVSAVALVNGRGVVGIGNQNLATGSTGIYIHRFTSSTQLWRGLELVVADAYGNQAIDLDSDGNIALSWLQNTSGYAVKSVRYQADLAAWRDVETLAAGSFMLDHGQTLLGNGDVQIDWRAPASVAGHFAVLDQSLVDAAGYAVHNDHLGTPQRITNSAQVVVWTADYLPFGEAQVGVGLIEENNRFPGQYFDGESGLHYNYFRDYDPTLGRYVQSDPIGLQGGLNTYAYAGGNPAKYIDPQGTIFFLAPVASAITGGSTSTSVAIGAGLGLGLVGAYIVGQNAVNDSDGPIPINPANPVLPGYTPRDQTFPGTTNPSCPPPDPEHDPREQCRNGVELRYAVCIASGGGALSCRIKRLIGLALCDVRSPDSGE